MSHPFGDLLSQHLHRKHGLSQSKLAAGIIQEPTIITKMCKGQRLNGPQARERVVAIMGWLHAQGVLDTLEEANALLDAAGMSALREREPAEAALLKRLRITPLKQTTRQTAANPRTNLPAQLTSFVGREGALAEVNHLIAEHRLVTLTGVGGVGKTRLSIEVALRMLPSAAGGADGGGFADGIWLVELASLADPSLVTQTIARVFKLPEQLDSSSLEALQDHLADKHVLLILDNCEHLIDACAEATEKLLQRCWNMRMLAASREALRVPGEVTYLVPSLTIPDALQSSERTLNVLDFESARLFVERVREAQSAFDLSASDAPLVADICRRLDGIPLALELAAPLARTMTLSDIAAQLDNQHAMLKNTYRTASPRHQTLHSALAWSYNLLSPPEQRLLARLSVFAGGWTPEAAEFMFEHPDATVLLSRLVDKSLVVAETKGEAMRYRLLEPIGQFAREQLITLDEREDAQQRHAACFLALAEAAEKTLDTLEEREWLLRLEVERDNLRAAIRWAIDRGDAEFAQRINAALYSFWIYASGMTEGSKWLEASLALRRDVRTLASVATEAKALNVAGYGAVLQADYARAGSRFEKAVMEYSEIGDRRGTAWSLRGRAFVQMLRGDLAEAQPNIEKSLALCREAEDEWGVAWSLYDLGYLKLAQGELAQAQSMLEVVLPRLQKQGILFGCFRTLLALGHVHHRQNHLERAIEYYREGLRVQQQFNFVIHTANGLEGLAGIAALRSQPVRAARLFGAAQARRKLIAGPRWAHYQAAYEQDVALARGQLEQDAWIAAWDEGRAMTIEQAVEYALAEQSSVLPGRT